MEHVAGPVAPRRDPPRVAGWPAAQSSGARSRASGGSGGPVGRERGRVWEGGIAQASGPNPQPTLPREQKAKSE